MAGIDSNTLLYLRGDSFVDLSLNNYTVSNDDGMTLINSDNFGKALDMTVASKRLNILDAVLPTDKFTIDWWEISKGASTANTALVTTLDDTHTDTSIKGIIMGKSSASAGPKLWSTTPSQTSSWVVSEWAFGNAITSNWVHRALVYDGTAFYAYENGKLFGTTTCEGLAAPSPSHIIIGGYRAQSACYNAHVENLRISNNIRWTEDFEPPTKPYTSVSLNVINQNNNEVNFSVTKESDNESINKVDILLNGNVIQTFNEGYDNINYTIDKAACWLGDNEVEIRAYYYNNFYESSSFVYNNTIEKLPEQPALPEIVDKLNEMKNSYSVMNDTLYETLSDRGCELTIDDKRMSTLVRKVEEFTDGIKEKLVEALIKEKIDVNIDNSFDELIGEIKNITDFPSWCVTSGGYWITGANMTTSRRYLSSGVVDTNIYCIGGYTGSSSSLNQKYDTLTNTWTAMTAMTASRYGLAVTSSKGKIYAMGGYSSATTNYCYDPSTNAWTTKTALPSSSYYSSTAEVDGIIYLISGYVGGSLSTTNRTYDVSTDTWSTISVLPAAVYLPSIGVYKNKIYVVGGYNSGAKTTNYCYDIINDSWSTLQAKTNTVYRAGQVAPVIDGKLYVIGGTGSSTYSTVNECYDIENNTWSTLTVLPTGRYGLTTQEVNGFIYCIGGYTGSYSNANQCFLPL